MDIAALNARITVQRRENASDGLGNRRTEWRDAMSCHATVSSESGRQEASEGVDAVDSTDIAFTVRWCRALRDVDNTGWRVVFRGRIYDVTGVDHLGYKNRAIKLLCKRVMR